MLNRFISENIATSSNNVNAKARRLQGATTRGDDPNAPLSGSDPAMASSI
jgi:hypothetical protein